MIPIAVECRFLEIICVCIGHSQIVLPSTVLKTQYRNANNLCRNLFGTLRSSVAGAHSPVGSQLTLPDLLQYPFITFPVFLWERGLLSLRMEPRRNINIEWKLINPPTEAMRTMQRHTYGLARAYPDLSEGHCIRANTPWLFIKGPEHPPNDSIS